MRAAPNRRGGRAVLAAVLGCLVLMLSASAASFPREDPLGREGVGAMAAVAEALSWLGTPYALGGSSKAGVDCSGFVCEVLKASGLCADPPRRSADYASFGRPIEGGMEPGDILVFGRGGRIDHVGMALSAESFIHAASEGPAKGVVISRLSEPSWARRFIAARRMEKVGE
jgi:cell wall-associated NlpC family hydrolase